MFLWPRSMVMPGCCCCKSRGADSTGTRWLMSLRLSSKAALVRATTSSSEMGVGMSLLIVTGRVGDLVIWRVSRSQTCCSGRGQCRWSKELVSGESLDAASRLAYLPGTA